jgi:RNA-binding protein
MHSHCSASAPPSRAVVAADKYVTLTGKQRRYLRSLGHHLEAVVQLGKQGITDTIVAATDTAIVTHELIKVRRGSECPQTRSEIADALSEKLQAEIVQQLGHTVLLYRRRAKDPDSKLPRIELPKR